MALTTLDPNIALVVIDLQRGLAGTPTVHPLAEVVARSRALADAFRARGLPVVLVNVAGTAPGRTEQPRRHAGALPDGFTDFLPELGQRPGDVVVTKRRWGAFAGTNLDERLRKAGITQLVLAGVATGAGVESTARQAYDNGFNVTLATDAMTDRHAETHDHCVRTVFPRIGETGLSADVLALLAGRA